MKETIVIPTGQQLIRESYAKGEHRLVGRVCPPCGEDLSRTGLPALVYTFERCVCSAAPYAHLIEQLYHRTCFVKNEREVTS